MKVKTSIKVWLCVVFCALLVIGITASSRWSAAPGPKTDQVPEESGYKTFGSSELLLSFMYPSWWEVKQEPLSAVDGSLGTILVKGANHEFIAIKVFDKPANVDEFVKTNIASYAMNDIKDIEATRSVIAGFDGYSWINRDFGKVTGGTLVFANINHLYVLNFTGVSNSDISAIYDVVHTLWAGGDGLTDLSFNLENLEYPDEAVINVQTCCDLTDADTNYYPCCGSGTGNCTWYCEYRIDSTGTDQSFPSYSDAYKWMYNAKYSSTKTYPTGGTIPEVGAIMVYKINGTFTYGHVMYVTGIATNGDVNVMEQNWCGTCTQSRTRTTSSQRDNLAGYIYADGSTPAPSACGCFGGYTGAETIIDDFRFSNYYYFQTYGPGFNYNTSYSTAYGWGRINGGYNSFFHYTRTRSSQLCYGRWSFTVTHSGLYEVQAYIPSTNGTADNARYNVAGTYSNGINQYNYSNVFVKVVNPNRTDGYWSFNTGTTYNVYLYDNYGGTAGKDLAFDALKLIKR